MKNFVYLFLPIILEFLSFILVIHKNVTLIHMTDHNL